MAHFRFAVSGQVLDLLTPTKGISDGLNINSFEFAFRSPEWAECTEKWVHFYNPSFNDGLPYDFNLIGDEISPERGVNLPAGLWDVFLHGSVIANNEVIKRYVTETQTINIMQSGVINAEPLASIEPSVAEQVSALAQAAYDARITAATVTINDAYGEPEATLTISGEAGTKLLTLTLSNLKGNGIEDIDFIVDGEDRGTVTVVLSNGESLTYTGIKEALDAMTALETTAEQAEEDRVQAEIVRQDNEEDRELAEAERQRAEARREHVYEDVVFRSVGIAFYDDEESGEVVIEAVSTEPVFDFTDSDSDGDVVITRVITP